MSFPPGTEMFQFPGFASTAYVFNCRYPIGVGCPIRTSTDQRLLAAPRGFSQRATSFIASWCQGIHRMPLSCSKSNHARKPSTDQADNRNRQPIHEQPASRQTFLTQHTTLHRLLNTRRKTAGRHRSPGTTPADQRPSGQTCAPATGMKPSPRSGRERPNPEPNTLSRVQRRTRT